MDVSQSTEARADEVLAALHRLIDLLADCVADRLLADRPRRQALQDKVALPAATQLQRGQADE